MRKVLPHFLIVYLVLAAGCSTVPNTPPAQTASATMRATQSPVDSNANAPAVAHPAAALAFSSTLPPAYPLVGLDRDARQPSAFFGYESATVETYSLYTDDDQEHWGGVGFGRGSWGGWGGGFGSAGWGDHYERRAVSVKSGEIYR